MARLRSVTRPQGIVGPAVMAGVLLAVMTPVLAVVLTAFRPHGDWGMSAFARILGQSRTWRLVGVTIAQAAVSSLVTVVVGVAVAWVLARYRFPGRTALRTLATVPFVLPSVVIGTAFASILGPRGLFDARSSWWVIIAAHLCFNLAVVVRTVGASFANLDPDLESAARLLGASRGSAARRVILPSVVPTITSSAIVVFLFCLTSFGVIVILGGGAVTTIEVEIWTRSTRQFDLAGAGVLSLLQFTAVIATLVVHGRISRRAGHQIRRSRRPSAPPRSVDEWALVASSIVGVVLISALPLAALAERSLRVGDGYGLDHWRNIGSVLEGTAMLVGPIDAVKNSLVAAIVATSVATVAALPVTRLINRRPGGFADRVMLLPLGVSATTIGLGYLLAVGRPPIDLRGSIWMVPVAQMLVALPLVVRAFLPGLRAVPQSLHDAGSLLGASRWEMFTRVELPLAKSALKAGIGLGFIACLGEFGATVFIARTDNPTVPVMIERLISRPGEAGFGQAMAMSTALALVCAAVILLVDLNSSRREGMELAF